MLTRRFQGKHKHPHPLVDARGGEGLNRMTKQVKKDDDMEAETKKVGKNGPAIVKNIYS